MGSWFKASAGFRGGSQQIGTIVAATLLAPELPSFGLESDSRSRPSWACYLAETWGRTVTILIQEAETMPERLKNCVHIHG